MKSVYVIALAALSSCTQLGQRVAYGPNWRTRAPQSVPEAVDQAVQVTKSVDAYRIEKKEQEQQAKESKYAAIQEREQLRDGYVEMRSNYLMLRGDMDALKEKNAALTRENAQFANQLTSINNQLESLKSSEVLLRQTISELTDRLNQQTVTTAPKTTKAVPAETVGLGDMAVVGGTSARRATDGSVSVRSGETRGTYTPRAAPVRRSQQVYHLGPRGGCYYYTNSGRKEYVDRSLCR